MSASWENCKKQYWKHSNRPIPNRHSNLVKTHCGEVVSCRLKETRSWFQICQSVQRPASFSVEFTRSLSISSLLPQSKHMQLRSAGNSEVPVGVNVFVRLHACQLNRSMKTMYEYYNVKLSILINAYRNSKRLMGLNISQNWSTCFGWNCVVFSFCFWWFLNSELNATHSGSLMLWTCEDI